MEEGQEVGLTFLTKSLGCEGLEMSKTLDCGRMTMRKRMESESVKTILTQCSYQLHDKTR